jgi:hypothetical protein
VIKVYPRLLFGPSMPFSQAYRRCAIAAAAVYKNQTLLPWTFQSRIDESVTPGTRSNARAAEKEGGVDELEQMQITLWVCRKKTKCNLRRELSISNRMMGVIRIEAGIQGCYSKLLSRWGAGLADMMFTSWAAKNLWEQGPLARRPHIIV